LFKNRISAAQKEEGKKKMPKKDPILKRGRERVYVLDCMVVTSPTSHVERLPLKAPAP